jgi:hypothetical protein
VSGTLPEGLEDYLAYAIPSSMGVRRRIRLSVKRPMNGYLRNVRQSWAEDAKPDSMIVGRDAGPGRHAGEAWTGPATKRSKDTAT